MGVISGIIFATDLEDLRGVSRVDVVSSDGASVTGEDSKVLACDS